MIERKEGERVVEKAYIRLLEETGFRVSHTCPVCGTDSVYEFKVR